ncbi:MAG: hypothetical protein ACTSRK_17705 [Promethearchaeota archaeon]
MLVKIQPCLRKNATLTVFQNENNLDISTPYIVLSNALSSPYSFICKIENINVAIPSEENPARLPILEVDKSLVGPIPVGETVELIVHQLPIAKSISLGVDNSYHVITPGNWTGSLNSFFVGDVIDFNHSLKAAINYEKSLMILRGVVLESDPPLPVSIDGSTQFFIQKYPSSDLTARAQQLELQKINRYHESREIRNKQIVEKLKNLDLPEDTVTMNISLSHKEFSFYNDSFQSFFSQHSIHDVHESQNGKKNNIQCMFYMLKGTEIAEIIEYSLVGGKKEALLTLKLHVPSAENLQKRKEELKTEFQKMYASLTGRNSGNSTRMVQSFILENYAKIDESSITQIPLVALMHDFLQSFPDAKISEKEFQKIIKKMDKFGMISNLEKLPTGFYMVHLHPPELTKDPVLVLNFAIGKSEFTRQELLTGLEWTEHRLSTALKFLQDKNLVKHTKNFRTGEKFFFS